MTSQMTNEAAGAGLVGVEPSLHVGARLVSSLTTERGRDEGSRFVRDVETEHTHTYTGRRLFRSVTEARARDGSNAPHNEEAACESADRQGGRRNTQAMTVTGWDRGNDNRIHLK